VRYICVYPVDVMQWKLDTVGDSALIKRSEHEKPNKGHGALKILAQDIAQQLEQRGFCVAFDRDLNAVGQAVE
jgi:hypothetical protein